MKFQDLTTVVDLHMQPQGVQANNICLHFFVLITMTIHFKGIFF